jgi:hypothetical protein
MNFKLRVELYDSDKLPNNIKNNVKNVNKYLRQVVQNIALNMTGWKYLDRCEESISTIDEKKQIRRGMYSNIKQYHIEFYSWNDTPVSVDEWKMFGKLLEAEINEIIHAQCGLLLICDITSPA